MRKVPLVTGEIYHVFNRGVNKADIFHTNADYNRFMRTFKYYLFWPLPKYSQRWLNSGRDVLNKKPLVGVLAYCLMPNHFHLLLKQIADNGITIFMRKVSNSYSHYKNLKSKRIGPLFQGRFKSVLVETDEQLSHLSRYIHLNPVVGGLVSKPGDYRWSSFKEYLGLVDPRKKICNTDLALVGFKNSKSYEDFVLDQSEYVRELNMIKHLTFESVE